MIVYLQNVVWEAKIMSWHLHNVHVYLTWARGSCYYLYGVCAYPLTATTKHVLANTSVVKDGASTTKSIM
jgi:hypothetical protein